MQDRIQQQIQDELTKTLEGAYMDALDRGHNVISGNGIEARIKQMAEEATYYADAMDGSGRLAGRVWSDVRDAYFARLVAEDCARVCEDDAKATSDPVLDLIEESRAGYVSGARNCADAIRARYAETKEG